MTVTAVPVDAEGLDVAAGVRSAAGAALAVLTPGQQAPLGMTMSLPRRLALLAWARRNDAWIIEDDYLSELQLKGRAAPACASLDHGGGFCTSEVSARPSARAVATSYDFCNME
jgi:GntR family transcriptional regulator/MocR family aminotransferase